MKFWAFLKDSYREAVSGWVLPTMLILVGLFVVLVASLSFRPARAEDELALRMKLVQFALLGVDRAGGHPEIVVENVQQLNDTIEPWKGDYSFDIVMRYPSAEEYRRGGSSFIEPRTAQLWKVWLRDSVPWLAEFTVSPPTISGVSAAKDKRDDEKQAGLPAATERPTLRFAVRTTGTKIASRKEWVHVASLFFGAVDLPPLPFSERMWVFRVQKTLVNDIGSWVILLVTVIVSAGFIPNTMRKGALDLLISKPVGRLELLLCKYVGGLVFTFLLVGFSVGVVYLLLGIRYDYWSLNFLAMVPLLTFYFAILYSVSTVIGVLTRNMLVSILVTLVAWGAFSLIGYGNAWYEESIIKQQRYEALMKRTAEPDEEMGLQQLFRQAQVGEVDPSGPGAFQTAMHYFHLPTPRTYDLDQKASWMIAEGLLTERELKQLTRSWTPARPWGTIIGVSSVFILAMLSLTYWRFATRDG